jgi:hypothetical protein
MQVFRRIGAEFADLSRPVAIYLVAVSAAAVSVATTLVLSGVGPGAPAALISLALIAAVTEWRGRIALRGKTLTVSISLFPSVFAAVLFGPLAWSFSVRPPSG